MNFFKKLFSKDEPFIATPSQQVPGLEPIVVQTIESLYPNIEDQKQVFKYSLKFTEGKKGITTALLALLCHSNGKTENLVDLDSPNLQTLVYKIIVDYGFSNMKAAEKWVKSITKSQA